jgi:hypothetical protein
MPRKNVLHTGAIIPHRSSIRADMLAECPLGPLHHSFSNARAALLAPFLNLSGLWGKIVFNI